MKQGNDEKRTLVARSLSSFITGFIVRTQAHNKSLLIVGAAASFKRVLDELVAVFEERYPDVDVRFHTSGSSMITWQLEAYAPIDVIMLASKNEADAR
jgi:ABC-type molybdate transport system substrate-binding protein